MSKSRNHLRTHTLPLPHFARKVAALGPDEPLHLATGDLAEIARVVQRSPSHLHRVIGGERRASASPDLIADIGEVVGVPVERIRLQGSKGGRPRRGDHGGKAA